MVYSKIILLISLFSLSLTSVFAQDETGGLKGKVRNSQNIAIPQVIITARQNDKDIKTATTDKSGAFEFSGLETGIYNLVFDKEGYNSAVFYNVQVEKKKVRDLGSRLVLKPDDGTLIIIRGIVFDQHGRSVRGANIDIERKQADGSYRKVKSTTSSYGVEPYATGEFIFRFPQGDSADYRITASSKGVSASKELTATNAAVYRLAITLNIKEDKEDK